MKAFKVEYLTLVLIQLFISLKIIVLYYYVKNCFVLFYRLGLKTRQNFVQANYHRIVNLFVHDIQFELKFLVTCRGNKNFIKFIGIRYNLSILN